MYVYKAQYKLEDKKLGTRDLFKILQDVSTAHSDDIGTGRAVFETKGLMWVVIRHYLDLPHYPRPGEQIEVQTWPGNNRHAMFPRFYQIKSADGETLVRGSSIWAVVDVNTRKMVNAKDHGIELEGIVTGDEAAMPSAARKLELSEQKRFIVPEKYLDVNVHMNNTRYFDLAEDCIGGNIRERDLRETSVEYISEARRGDEILVSWGGNTDEYYITGENEGQIFRMNLKYI